MDSHEATSTLRSRKNKLRKRPSATPATTTSLGPVVLEHLIGRILNSFPDADPDFLRQILPHHRGTEAQIVNDISTKLLSIPYPTVLRQPSGVVDVLRTQNRDLIILHDAFPGVELSALRTSIQRYSACYVYRLAQALIDDPKRHSGDAANARPIERADLIRPFGYLDRLASHLSKTFPSISGSTLAALAVENRYQLAETLAACDAEMKRRGWFGRFWDSMRRKLGPSLSLIPEGALARPAGDAYAGDAEWDREWRLYTADEIKHTDADHVRLAKLLNESQYAAEGQLLECGCCFGDFTFEDVDACTSGHLFCKACITAHVKALVFGQGASPDVLTCMSINACTGHFSEPVLRRSLSPDEWRGYVRAQDERVANALASASGIKLLCCPFCPYAEYEDKWCLETWWSGSSSSSSTSPVQRAYNSIVCISLHAIFLLMLLVHPYFIPVPASLPTRGFLFPLVDPPSAARLVSAHIHRILATARRPSTLFRCRNLPAPSPDPALPPVRDETCGKVSCTLCSRVVVEGLPHTCARAPDDLRLRIERAMAEAVKRTCPRCQTSFVKSDGCNKMKCACGYQMCYICREDVSSVSYAHFCQHFRAIPGSKCTQCDRCDLYRVEDEAAIKIAASRAKEEWMAENAASDVSASREWEEVRVGPPSRIERDMEVVRRSMDQLIALLLGWC